MGAAASTAAGMPDGMGAGAPEGITAGMPEGIGAGAPEGTRAGAGIEPPAATAAGIGSVRAETGARADVGGRADSGTVSAGMPMAVGALEEGPMPPGGYGLVGSVNAARGCVLALVGTVMGPSDWLGGTRAGCSGRVRSSREASRAAA